MGKLTKAGGLMEQTIQHVKASNRLAQHNNQWIKIVTYMFAVSVVLLLAVGVLAWRIFSDVVVVEHRLRDAIVTIEDLSERLKITERKLNDVKKDTEEAKEARDTSPTIELIPEKDPKKARESPVKVRIIPPKKGEKEDSNCKTEDGCKREDPPPPSSAVEVPLPMQKAVVTPDSGG